LVGLRLLNRGFGCDRVPRTPLNGQDEPEFCRAFGGYEVIQPVKQEVLVPRGPFQG
jgi:hypothetical protein